MRGRTGNTAFGEGGGREGGAGVRLCTADLRVIATLHLMVDGLDVILNLCRSAKSRYKSSLAAAYGGRADMALPWGLSLAAWSCRQPGRLGSA